MHSYVDNFLRRPLPIQGYLANIPRINCCYLIEVTIINRISYLFIFYTENYTIILFQIICTKCKSMSIFYSIMIHYFILMLLIYFLQFLLFLLFFLFSIVYFALYFKKLRLIICFNQKIPLSSVQKFNSGCGHADHTSPPTLSENKRT